MKTWNSSPQQLSVLPFKCMAKFFGLQRMWPIILYLFVLLSKIFLFFCDKFWRKRRHLLFFKNIYLMYVSKRSVLWIFQSFVTIIFILLYWWTRYLLLGTISWHLQTQHFITSLQFTSEGPKWPETWYF